MENKIDQKLGYYIKKMGGLYIKLLTSHFTGLPDRLCLLPGAVIRFVELKSPGNKPRKIQRIVHDKLRKLGFRVDVVDSFESIKEFLSGLQNDPE